MHTEAYVTLSDCANQKDELQQKIDESNEKIGNKRKQMESLREELRVLGQFERDFPGVSYILSII